MRRWYELLGVAGSIIAFIAIAVSIHLSPWFLWDSNALSDLGHVFHSDVASIFNLGLSLASMSTHCFARMRTTPGPNLATRPSVGVLVSKSK